MNQGGFKVSGEDFPALGGGGNRGMIGGGAVGGGGGGFGMMGGQAQGNQGMGQGNQGMVGVVDNQGPVNQGPGNLGGGGGGGGRREGGEMVGAGALQGEYGLLGLLGVIRMSDADRNSLSLGSDLTSLGLNLGSTENLYTNFAGPYTSKSTTREPHYQLPMCYYMHPPALKTGHLSKFQLETLFHIFYALPRDVLQAYAAQELYARQWRYHTDLKLWFKRNAVEGDGNPTGEKSNQFVYFDTNSWEQRVFNGAVEGISRGLLPEQEVRVKFGS